VLEYNGENCLHLAAVDFHVLTNQPCKNHVNKIVVLRKRELNVSTADESRLKECSNIQHPPNPDQNEFEITTRL